MKNTAKPFILTIALPAACCALGCAQFQAFELPAEPAHTKGNFQEKGGIAVAAQLLFDPQTVKHHFGPDLLKAGYLPLLVYLEGRGGNSFEIQRKNCSIVLENGERFEPAPPQEVFSRVRRSTLPSLLFAPLVLPAILLYRYLEDYNFAAARTLYQKSLPGTLRVEPGDPPIVRAVFFRNLASSSIQPRVFESSVLHLVVEVEGSRPEDMQKLLSLAPSAGAAEPPVAGTEDKKSSQPDGARPAIGRLVTFTVSLTGEDG